MRVPALPILLLASTLRALDATDIPSVQGRAVDTAETDLVRRMKAVLAEDPARAAALAERILRSSLRSHLAAADEPGVARRELEAWIAENPAAAASLAVGFARDDAEGSHAFERSLYKQAERFLELSPDRGKGILGRLDGLGSAAKAIKSDSDLSDDERKRLMKELFEGRSSVDKSDKDAQRAGGKDGPRPEGAAAVTDSGSYDRLSAANITGYSPQVQALQNELNRQAPPNAPRLAESGKLDHATLVFPGFALRYDLGRLEAAVAPKTSEAALPRDSARSAADPAVPTEPAIRSEERLESSSMKRRRAALRKARTALTAFEKAAEPAKAPAGVTAALLKTLSSRRREAARWVILAALEGTLSGLEELAHIRTDALRAALGRAPVTEEERRRFLEGGAALEARAGAALAGGRRAAELLERHEDAASWAEAENLIAKARAAARALPEEAAAYRSAPERLAATLTPQARWRTMLEDAAQRFLPATAFAKDAALRRKTAAAARADFARFLR